MLLEGITLQQEQEQEHYDHLATLDQIRNNLSSAILEYIDEFGAVSFANALNETLNPLGFSTNLKVGRNEK